MKSLRESLLSDIEDTLNVGDVTADEMCKLNYRLQYFNTHSCKAIRGGRSKLVEKYFNKSVPTLFTDRHSTLETLLKKPERKHKLNKLDIDGDYLAILMIYQN